MFFSPRAINIVMLNLYKGFYITPCKHVDIF